MVEIKLQPAAQDAVLLQNTAPPTPPHIGATNPIESWGRSSPNQNLGNACFALAATLSAGNLESSGPGSTFLAYISCEMMYCNDMSMSTLPVLSSDCKPAG
ncbi:hypothetical protein XPA_004686 [Xanthoria parietina]